MPSVSKKQAHLMSAVAHGWQPPGRHIDPKVAQEFHAADKQQGKWEHPNQHEHAKRLAHALKGKR